MEPQKLKLRSTSRSAISKHSAQAHVHGTRQHAGLSKSPPNTTPRSPPRSPASATGTLPKVPEAAVVSPADHSDHEEVVTPASPSPDAGLQQTEETDVRLRREDVAEYFEKATQNFEAMIRSTMDTFLSKLHDVEANMAASIEFERERINDLEDKQDRMEKKIHDMENEITHLKSEVEIHTIAANKNERFSRRNNVRLIGIPEPQEGQREDCIQITEDILKTKFGIQSKVERAHRDGRKNDQGKSRHILIKFLSYRDKIEVMRNTRNILTGERYFITDDLTPLDLKEKQKWVKQVQELYQSGVKLRFYAGKWRQLGGTLYKFD